MKPWRTVAKPHTDVLTGTLKQSEFAADLSRVAEGSASKEYQDAVQFFDRIPDFYSVHAVIGGKAAKR